jgi:site-specific recombinase XerD
MVLYYEEELMEYTFPVPELHKKESQIQQDDSLKLISEKVQQYLNTYDKKTVKAYKSDMQTFFDYLKKNPSELHESDILGYIKYMENQDFKKNTINRKIASLSKVLDIYKKLGIVKTNPVHTLSQDSRIYKRVDKKVSFNCTLKDVEEVVKRANPRTGVLCHFLQTQGYGYLNLYQ